MEDNNLLMLVGITSISVLINIWSIGMCIRRSRCTKINLCCMSCDRNVLSSETELEEYKSDPIRRMISSGLSFLSGSKSRQLSTNEVIEMEKAKKNVDNV